MDELKDMFLTVGELQNIGTKMLRAVTEICEREGLHYNMFFGSLLGTVRHHAPIPWDYDIDIAVPENELERFVETMQRELPADYWVDFRSGVSSPKCFARIGLKGYDTHTCHIDVYRLIGYPDGERKQRRFSKRGMLLLEMRLVKETDLRMYNKQTQKKKIRLIKLFRTLLKPISSQNIVKRFDKLCKKYPYESADMVGINAVHEFCVYKRSMADDSILADYTDFQVRIPREFDYILRDMYNEYMKFPPKEQTDRILSRRYGVYALKPQKNSK